MKKILTILLLLSASLVACDKNDDGGSGSVSRTITGKINDMPAGSGYQIVAVAYANDQKEAIASADVSSTGTFSLTLPTTLESKFLDPYDELEMEGITVSNKNVSISTLNFELRQNGSTVDDLLFAKLDLANAKIVMATYTYADASFTMKGDTYTFENIPATVNASFSKGWNWMVTSFTFTMDGADIAGGSAKISTNLPSGLSWYLDSEFNN